jgi:hypothetical protein
MALKRFSRFLSLPDAPIKAMVMPTIMITIYQTAFKDSF